MTFLTRREIYKFQSLVDDKCWDDVAEYGEQLLKKDPRDGAGIRYGIMDAYAELGDAEGAEDLAIRYSEAAEDYFDMMEFKSGAEILEEMDEEEEWMDTVEDGMAFQFAMALWKDEREEDAIRVLNSMPEELQEYLELDEEEFDEKREEMNASFGYRPGTVEEYIACIAIPYEDQEEFREWIGSLRRTDDGYEG